MTTFLVKVRHLTTGQEQVLAAHETREAAAKHALAANCKPFTPYYAWVEPQAQ